MRWNRLTSVVMSAVATMALTLALLGPGRAEAIDREADGLTKIKPLILAPQLELDGLVVKLALDKEQYAPGDKPVIHLEVTNPTDEEVRTRIHLGMMSSGVQDVLSRAPAMPMPLWNDQCDLVVASGDTLRLEVVPGKSLEENAMVSVTMTDTAQGNRLSAPLGLRRGSRAIHSESPTALK